VVVDRLSDLDLDGLPLVVVAATADGARRVRPTFRLRGPHDDRGPTAVRFPGRTLRQSARLQESFQGGCVKTSRDRWSFLCRRNDDDDDDITLCLFTYRFYIEFGINIIIIYFRYNLLLIVIMDR